MKNILAILALITFLPNFAFSQQQQLQDVINEQNRVIQNQQQLEQSKENQRELQQVETERKNLNEKSAQIIQNRQDEKCQQVKRIIFSKNKIFSKTQEKNLTSNYANKCLIKSQIEQLLSEISNELIKNGHITSKAVINKEIENGEIYIQIEEGVLEDLVFNDDDFGDKLQKFSAFGSVKKGQVLDLHDIEIGLDQINRLRSNNATVKILPASEKNASIIAVQNKPQQRLRTSFAFDDLGSRATGKHRDTIGLSFDNLLKLNDNLNISRSANDFTQKKEEGRNSSVNIAFSLPFKNNLLTISSIRYRYSLQTESKISPKRAYGYSNTNNVALESMIVRKNKYRLNANFSLVERDIANYIDEIKLDVSSRKTVAGNFALANSFLFDNASIYLKPTYSKGLKILNSKKDDPSAPSSAAHAQFDILRFYGNYSHNLEIPRVRIPFSYSLTLDSQVSKQHLYANDQFYVGGPFTVRGFENGSIAGDAGYMLRNEFKLNIGKVLTQIIPEFSQKKYFSKWYNNFSISPFYDYGYARMKGGQSGRLAGAGLKTSFNHKNLSANLTWAWVVNKSELLQNYYRENQAVYFDVTTEIGFF